MKKTKFQVDQIPPFEVIQESEHKILCFTKLSGADNLNFIKTAGFWNNFQRSVLINLKLGLDVFSLVYIITTSFRRI